MKAQDSPILIDPEVAVNLPDKNLDDAIANANMRLAAHQTLVNHVESKATNFLMLIITVTIALFAAAAVSFSRAQPNYVEIVAIIAAIIVSLVCSLILVLKVITRQELYLPGQDPKLYLLPEFLEWMNGEAKQYGDKALNALYLRELDYYCQHNLNAINRQTKEYRAALTVYTVSITALVLAYAVISFLKVLTV